MPRARALFLALVAGAAVTSHAAEPLPPGAHPRTFTSAIDGSEQPYNLFIPTAAAKGTPLPTYVALHGKGATWQSWFAATTVKEWAEENGFVVICPHGRGDLFYRGNGTIDVFEAIDDARLYAPIDRERTFLIGHSMGGWGTWFLGTSRPDFWAGIAPMAGWAPDETIGNAAYLDPYLAHGMLDEAVDPLQTTSASARLGNLGISHRLLMLPEFGHESKMISVLLPRIAEHFRTKTRPTAPPSVSFVANSTFNGSAWWLRVIEIATTTQPASDGERYAFQPASIDARLEGNHLKIETAAVKTLQVDPSSLPPWEGESLGVLLDATPFQIPRADMQGKWILFTWEDREPPTPGEGKAAFFTTRPGNPRWQVSIRDEAATPMDSPIGRRVSRDEQIPALLAQMVTEGRKDEYFLFSPTLVLPELSTGEIRRRDIADFFVRGNSNLDLVQVKAGELETALRDQSGWMPTWWSPASVHPPIAPGDPHRTVTLHFINPMGPFVHKALNPRPVQTMWRPPLIDQLYDHVMKTGEL